VEDVVISLSSLLHYLYQHFNEPVGTKNLKSSSVPEMEPFMETSIKTASHKSQNAQQPKSSEDSTKLSELNRRKKALES
jgi:hypothetical protein